MGALFLFVAWSLSCASLGYTVALWTLVPSAEDLVLDPKTGVCRRSSQVGVSTMNTALKFAATLLCAAGFAALGAC